MKTVVGVEVMLGEEEWSWVLSNDLVDDLDWTEKVVGWRKG